MDVDGNVLQSDTDGEFNSSTSDMGALLARVGNWRWFLDRQGISEVVVAFNNDQLHSS